MRTAESEITDLALTQAIERYSEMDPDAVCDAIATEWPEQIAVLLTELLFKTTCGGCNGTPDFIQMERETSGSTYMIPVCSCDQSEWRSE